MDNWQIWDEFEEMTLIGFVVECCLGIVSLTAFIAFILLVAAI